MQQLSCHLYKNVPWTETIKNLDANTVSSFWVIVIHSYYFYETHGVMLYSNRGKTVLVPHCFLFEFVKEGKSPFSSLVLTFLHLSNYCFLPWRITFPCPHPVLKCSPLEWGMSCTMKPFPGVILFQDCGNKEAEPGLRSTVGSAGSYFYLFFKNYYLSVFFRVHPSLNWSQVSAQLSPGCLWASHCCQGYQKSSSISSWRWARGAMMTGHSTQKKQKE